MGKSPSYSFGPRAGYYPTVGYFRNFDDLRQFVFHHINVIKHSTKSQWNNDDLIRIEELEKLMYEGERCFIPTAQQLYSGRQQGKSLASYMKFSDKKPAPLSAITTWGEITAYRVWRVRQDGIMLSTYTDTIWCPGEIIKAHVLPRDNDGNSQERTGIHGWKSLVETIDFGKGVLNYYGQYNITTDQYRDPAKFSLAIGRIKLWGEVVEHERGYRAEFARIIGVDDLLELDVLSRPWHSQFIRNGTKLAGVQELYFPELRAKRRPPANG